MKTKRLSKTFTVPASAIDAMGHVNNLVYLEWCLEVAEAHWNHLSDSNLRENYVWYVLEHHIYYKNAAFENQELLIETWVTTAEGVRSERQYRISRTSDQKPIVEARTLWCLLDAKSERPTPVTEEIRTLFL